jgi:type IV pilus assembly protein PilX
MNHTTPSQQTGITLPVVLMFLLILTVAASFGIRRSTLAEGISRNQLDYEVSRQAAEAALRDGERDLLLPNGTKPAGALCGRGDENRATISKINAEATTVTALTFTSQCLNGQCGFMPGYYDTSNYATGVNPEPWWPTSKGGLWNDGRVVTGCNFNGGVPIGTFTGTPAVKGVALQPEYLIEDVSRGDQTVFRITARGFGADIRTETIVQSYVEIK